MRTSLSKSEFASALGMKPDAIFVKKMFSIVDKDKDGRISFQVKKITFKTKEKKVGNKTSSSRFLIINQLYFDSYSKDIKCLGIKLN